jgi:guanylate kinase
MPVLGNLFIVAAPSGGGKTSLVKQVLGMLDSIEVSISHTTRPKRKGEQDGIDYFFIDQKRFNDMVQADAFVEHARVFDYDYGTSFAQINERLELGIDVLLDIDWQGAQQIKMAYPNAVTIFIVPPSLEVLRERLLSRGRDDQEVILQRMMQAQDEMSHYTDFDYLIVNDTFENAVMVLRSIIVAERVRRERQQREQAKLLLFLLSKQ